MSDDTTPQDAPKSPKVQPLEEVVKMTDDDVLDYTRRIRVRHVEHTLNSNQGLLPSDPEEQRLFLSALKDLDTQAGRNKLVGAKEKASAVDREAAQAVHRMLSMMGDHPMRRAADPALEHIATNVPSIADATNLPPLTLVPDEIMVGVDTVTYDEFMEKNG